MVLVTSSSSKELLIEYVRICTFELIHYPLNEINGCEKGIKYEWYPWKFPKKGRGIWNFG